MCFMQASRADQVADDNFNGKPRRQTKQQHTIGDLQRVGLRRERLRTHIACDGNAHHERKPVGDIFGGTGQADAQHH